MALELHREDGTKYDPVDLVSESVNSESINKNNSNGAYDSETMVASLEKESLELAKARGVHTASPPDAPQTPSLASIGASVVKLHPCTFSCLHCCLFVLLFFDLIFVLSKIITFVHYA